MTVVILAAGTSSRMNGANKLLLEWDEGECLIERTIRTALSFCSKVFVVTGHERSKVQRILLRYPVTEIYNRNYEQGQESSIHIAAESIDDNIYYIPADLPLLKKDHLVRAMLALQGYDAARPVHNGQVGHPVAVTSAIACKIRKNPDLKMKELIKASNHNFYEDDEAVVADVDTEQAYSDLRRRFVI